MLNMYWISSLIIGLVFVGVEFLLAFGILLGIREEDSTTLTGCVIFYGLVPGFIILGLPIAVWDRIKPKNKMLYFPFLMLFGLFGLVPLSNLMAKTTLSSLSLYILSGPPVAVFFWQFLALVNLYRRRIFYFLLTFGCMFFWAPVYLIYAFSNTTIFSGLESLLQTIAIIFFA